VATISVSTATATTSRSSLVGRALVVRGQKQGKMDWWKVKDGKSTKLCKKYCVHNQKMIIFA
jgi:hypothetical protein